MNNTYSDNYKNINKKNNYNGNCKNKNVYIHFNK